MRHLWSAIFLLCIGAADVAAQQAPALTPGTRVRVVQSTTASGGARTQRGATHVGTLQAIDSSSVTLMEGGQSTEYPLNIVSRLEVSSGSASRSGGAARGATRGALIGAGASALTVGVLILGGKTEECEDGVCEQKNYDIKGGPAVVIGVGTLVGAGVGALIGGAAREQWTPVWTRAGGPVSLTVDPASSGGARVGLTLRF
ncbi:MAG TPA: hypothetical protein VF665_08370 [Longimicrobium sp.]|jgi:hypothetical protein|uniref:hypothetical protein n=1 Tax=Longimicrobium sp. TaxID=2029185 RepID=UPI002EDA12BE